MRPLPSSLLKTTPKNGYQANKEHELEENGSIASPAYGSKPLEIKKAKWTVALKKSKNLLYVDNWSCEGKSRFNEVGKKLQKIHTNKTLHQAHVDVWNEWNACTNTYPMMLSNNHNQENYDPETHGRRNMTSEPAKLSLTAKGDFDCTQIFEISLCLICYDFYNYLVSL